MEEVTLTGLAATAQHSVGVIGSTIQGLHSLRGKFEDADNTIRRLINQLSSVKACVSQFHDWTEFNSDDSPKGTEFMRALKISLEKCQSLIDVLAEDVKNLTSLQLPNPLNSLPSQQGVKDEGKPVWNDATMKHQTMLFGQVQALLQLLLTAAQW
jgi:hypothetical protein